MNVITGKAIKKEAEMQIKALKQIKSWIKIAIFISALGVAAAYAGFSGETNNFLLGIPGIFLMSLGILLAAVMNLGVKNGKRNVERMLDLLSEGGSYEA